MVRNMEQRVIELLDQANVEFVEGSSRTSDKCVVQLRCKTVHQHTTEVIWSNLKQRPYCIKCGDNNKSLAMYVPLYQYDLQGIFVQGYNELGDILDHTSAQLYAIKKAALKGGKAYGHIWSILAPVDGILNKQKERTAVEADVIEKLNL